MYFSLNFLRFINLVQNSSLERKPIKDYAKSLRIEYLIKNSDLTCEKSFIPLNFIPLHFEKLSQMVGNTKSSYEINSNLSRSDINSAAEMFMALNSCPSFYVKLYWKVIYGNESRMAKLASNIIQKAKDGFKARAQKIFAKISSMLGFKHVTYNHDGERTSKNILDIEGEELSTSTQMSRDFILSHPDIIFLAPLGAQGVQIRRLSLLGEMLSRALASSFCSSGLSQVSLSSFSFLLPS